MDKIGDILEFSACGILEPEQGRICSNLGPGPCRRQFLNIVHKISPACLGPGLPGDIFLVVVMLLKADVLIWLLRMSTTARIIDIGFCSPAQLLNQRIFVYQLANFEAR